MIILPKKIFLTAASQHWNVSYIHAPSDLTLIEFPHRRLVVHGSRYSKRAVIKLLIKWIKLKAADYLTTYLFKLNRKIRAKYKRIRIHALNTEWGSCSMDKIISINYRLIFLPRVLVRHLIIHELCHVRNLNHSPKFWIDVAKYDKQWLRNKTLLHEGDEHIPRWLIV